MRCPRCGGTGHVRTLINTKYGLAMDDLICNYCDGEGRYGELTNEEWFNKLSIEDKAKWLAENQHDSWDAKNWERWLKEKHVEKKGTPETV